MRAGVDGEVGKVAGEILREPLGGDHGGVVGTEPLFGQNGADAGFIAQRLQLFAQVAVGGDPAPRGDDGAALLLCGGDGALGEHVAGGALEGGGDVCTAERLSLLLFVVAVVDEGGFQAAVRKVAAVPLKHFGKGNVRAALPRELFDVRAAGVRQAEHARGLVEGFAGGVVARGAHDLKFRIALRIQNGGMPAAREQGDEGRGEGRLGKVCRRHVTADVVDGDERDAQRIGKGLGEGEPHEQRADQPRAVGDGDGVEFAGGNARLGEGALHRRADGVGMGAGGDFGNDAAVLCLLRRGGQDGVGEQAAAADDRRARFVARAFDAEDERLFFQRQRRKALCIPHKLHLLTLVRRRICAAAPLCLFSDLSAARGICPRAHFFCIARFARSGMRSNTATRSLPLKISSKAGL